MTGGDIRILHSHSLFVVTNGGGEGDEHEPCKAGALPDVVGKASQGVMLCRPSMLSGTAGEADMEEGEIVHPTVGKVVRSRERSWQMRWLNRDHDELL